MYYLYCTMEWKPGQGKGGRENTRCICAMNLREMWKIIWIEKITKFQVMRRMQKEEEIILTI